MERAILKKDSNEKEKKDNCCKLSCQLCCETLNNYCSNLICNMCGCRKNKTENVCCCCSNYDEKHFDKDIQCFCYCYQEKSLLNWINKFFINKTQKTIVICMVLYFISKLSVIGCQNKYENILQNYDILEEMPVFLISLAICFFSFTYIIVFIHIKNCYCKKRHKKDKNKDLLYYLEKFIFKKNISTIGLGLTFILNLSTGSYYTIYFFLNKLDVSFITYFNDDKSFWEKLLLYSTIMINAYFVLLLNYYCLIITKNQIDFGIIFSQSISITIYFIILDFLFYLLKLLQNFNIYLPFYIQLIPTSIFMCIFVIYSLIYPLRILCIVFISLLSCYRYEEGHFISTFDCCCNKDKKCHNDCCETYLADINCSYLCCEPCILKIKNILK